MASSNVWNVFLGGGEPPIPCLASFFGHVIVSPDTIDIFLCTCDRKENTDSFVLLCQYVVRVQSL